jgi:hypothetical protein
MRRLALYVVTVLAVQLPLLFAGSIFLPASPPPLLPLLITGGLAAAASTAWMACAADRATAVRRSVYIALMVLAVLAYPLIATPLGIGWPSRVDGIAAAAYVALVVYGLSKIRRLREKDVAELQGTLALVVTALALTIWFWRWQPYIASTRGPWRAVVSDLARPPQLAPGRADDPDIIHVVLDGLGRPDLLSEKFGIDVAPEVAALERLGIRLQPNAVANYAQTGLAMAAILNMRYLDPLAPVLGSSPDRQAQARLIQESGVIAALKRRGYEFTYIGSSFFALQRHPLADVCHCDAFPIDEPQALLALSPFRSLQFFGNPYDIRRTELSRAFERLATVPPSRAARYVLTHVLAPHPPFVVGPDGPLPDPPGPYEILDASGYPGTKEEYRTGYAAQTLFVLRAVHDALRRQLSVSSRPAVIIVQGDHGPAMDVNLLDVPHSDLRERFRIFLAVRWAAGGREPAGELTSPVNIYRRIFFRYFGADTPPLPDRSLVSGWNTPYLTRDIDSHLLASGAGKSGAGAPR